MSTFISYRLTWPVWDPQALTNVQDVAAGNSFIFNGNLADPAFSPAVSFIKYGFIRSVSITSANNVSGVNFTITGLQNGVVVSEVVAGPNIGTENGLIAFDEVTSVTVNGNVDNVSIGTGDVGYLRLMGINTRAMPVLNYGLQVNTDDIKYDIFQTYYDVFNNGKTFAQQILDEIFLPVEQDQVDSEIFVFSAVTNCLLLRIKEATNVDGSLAVVYMQA